MRMTIDLYPVSSSNPDFLGNAVLNVTAEDVLVIDDLRLAVRKSKLGGIHGDARHAQFVPDKNAPPPKKGEKPKGKWWNQLTLGPVIQKGLDAAMNLAWGKAANITLEYNPSSSSWKYISSTKQASMADLIEGADAFMTESVSSAGGEQVRGSSDAAASMSFGS